MLSERNFFKTPLQSLWHLKWRQGNKIENRSRSSLLWTSKLAAYRQHMYFLKRICEKLLCSNWWLNLMHNGLISKYLLAVTGKKKENLTREMGCNLRPLFVASSAQSSQKSLVSKCETYMLQWVSHKIFFNKYKQSKSYPRKLYNIQYAISRQIFSVVSWEALNYNTKYVCFP